MPAMLMISTPCAGEGRFALRSLNGSTCILGLAAGEFVQLFAQFGGRRGAWDRDHEVALLVHDVRFRYGLDSIFVADLGAVVRSGWVFDAKLAEKSKRVLFVVEVPDSDENHVLIFEFIPERVKVRGFRATWPAPTCPEVDQHDFTPMHTEFERLAIVGFDREVGRDPAF